LTHKDGLYKPTYSCPHTEDGPRGHVGTYRREELAEALDAGYRVTRNYRNYLWDKSDFSDELFKEYIKKIMRLKYMAEGWPPSCTDKNISEEERHERKMDYLADACMRFGLEMSVDDIKSNPGLKCERLIKKNYQHLHF
jgi:hypothetical protein